MHLLVRSKGRSRPIFAVSLFAMIMTAAACERPTGLQGPAGATGATGNATLVGSTNNSLPLRSIAIVQ